LAIAQELRLWMPFGERPDVLHHLQCTALVGNPNELGSYLGVAALVAIAAWPTPLQRGSAWKALTVALLVAGLVASQTLTALVAFAIAFVVLFAADSWRKAARAVAIVGVTAAVLVLLVSPLRERASTLAQWARKGDYNVVLTGRGRAFVAASLMFADRPLAGVGPGAFAWHYFDYKIRVEKRYPSLRDAYNRGVNFGEVHNDHLQVLAEGGILGYAGFLLGLGALAAISFRPSDVNDSRATFARRLALPLAVYWAVLSLAQFPLETAVVRTTLIHFAALCAAWRSS
jgi:O-antigen ligase